MVHPGVVPFRGAWSAFLTLMVLASTGEAQVRREAVGTEVFAGGEFERYLRTLQVAGAAPLHPWSLRAFSPTELDRLAPPDTGHPWARRVSFAGPRRRGPTLDLIAPSSSAWFNSGFPYGGDDGAVWQGRGATVAASAGVALRWGPLSARLAPIVFRAQNRGFLLYSNGQGGAAALRNGYYPDQIDAPQRFGEGPYARLDPGQSEVRLDLAGLTLGASTADQVWGPADRYPLILGNNAPGLPRVFFGTSRPWDLWLMRVSGRVEWADLRESPQSSGTFGPDVPAHFGVPRRRFGSGLAVVVTPRGMPGVEIGGARFFHSPWPYGGPTFRSFLKPFEGFIKSTLHVNVPGFAPGSHGDPDNQLASVFMRWVAPRGGFEVYAEYAREDHSEDFSDLMNELDHSAGFDVGARRVWRRRGGGLTVLRFEHVDTQWNTLTRGRHGYPYYTQAYVITGHTERGQVMGSPEAALGAEATTVAADWYSPRGRVSVSYEWWLRATQGTFYRTGVPTPRRRDVSHALGIEWLRFAGPCDVALSATALYELNRDFARDAFNLHASATVRVHP